MNQFRLNNVKNFFGVQIDFEESLVHKCKLAGAHLVYQAIFKDKCGLVFKEWESCYPQRRKVDKNLSEIVEKHVHRLWIVIVHFQKGLI